MTYFGILAILLLIILLIFFNRAMKDGWYLLLHRTGLQHRRITEEDRIRINGYLQNFSYYLALSPVGKEKFVTRLFTFMLNKEFRGREGLVVTEEMRVLISASAIQLTFGLENYRLESLQSIFVYPDTFHLSEYSPEYKGATYGHHMHISWKAFQEGYSKADDNLNLGLHEMTHALKLALYLGNHFDMLFAGRMEYWEQLVAEKFRSFSQTPTFLREYSKANTEEFFAVCVEAFFESPAKFRKELPEIFQLLLFLLNQDPENKSGDYQVNEGHFTGNRYELPRPEEVKVSYKYSNHHWSINLLVLGTIGFIPTVFIVSRYFLFSSSGYFVLFLFMGTLGLLQKRYFFERKILSGFYFIMYAYAGFGASFTILLLWLNFFVPASDTHVEKFSIHDHKGMRGYTSVSAPPNTSLEEDLHNNEQVLSSKKNRNSKYLMFNYHYGILGIKKVDDFYFTDKE